MSSEIFEDPRSEEYGVCLERAKRRTSVNQVPLEALAQCTWD